jgi:hypothetical protein
MQVQEFLPKKKANKRNQILNLKRLLKKKNVERNHKKNHRVQKSKLVLHLK